jgi:hypothetical protein
MRQIKVYHEVFRRLDRAHFFITAESGVELFLRDCRRGKISISIGRHLMTKQFFDCKNSRN